MDTVIYIANAGYYFPEDYPTQTINGVTVKRKNDTWLTVSGVPTADTYITLREAESVDTRPYRVTVNNGSGSGEYGAGTEVVITADAPQAGMKFCGWKVVKGEVLLTDSKRTTTTFVMKIGEVEISAEYERQNGETSPGEQAEEVLSKEQKEKNAAVLNQTLKADWEKDGICVRWNRLAAADGYDLFAASGNGKLTKTPVKTVKGKKKTSAKISRIRKKKLDAGKTYQIKVKAYRMVKGKKQYIGDSQMLYVAGAENTQYTNAKSIKLSQKTYVLKRKETADIKAVVKPQDKSKKLFRKKNVGVLRYRTTNKKIAVVTKTGRIKAVGKGRCFVYVTAMNGVNAKVRVRVK
ncbi:MAG: Ig-like domain-containing protein [Bacteroidales bacterium]|nr:Ig-like domain-containing protein [Clostridium sp.]MCM1203427.1 Ig-like domain-containing protein [Bacteroidales bacterium]